MLLAACAPILRAQTPAAGTNPFLGSWRLNLEKSQPASPLPRNFISVRVYEDGGGGLMLHTVVNSYAGGAGFLFTAAKYDGREYPVYTSTTLGALLNAGQTTTYTVVFKSIDAWSIEYQDRHEGKITATGTFKISSDGKTMTEVDKNYDASGKERSRSLMVYDKQ